MSSIKDSQKITHTALHMADEAVLVATAPVDAKWSFDDWHIGEIAQDGSALASKAIARPTVLSRDQWYILASDICAILNNHSKPSTKAVAAVRRQAEHAHAMYSSLVTIVSLLGNVDHSIGNGANSARMRGELLNDIKAIAERALSAEPAQVTHGLGWVVRERRGSDGELLDCFVEAPRCEEMPYALEVLGDDYTGYGDVEAKLEHCKLIVAWANAAPTPEAGNDKG